MIIATAGKGGTGKTTIAALIVKYLIEQKKEGVLVLDADPNANLGDYLGVGSVETMVGVVDDLAKQMNQTPGSMSKDNYVQLKVQQAVCEQNGFDFLAMGRPEGPGCYCYANTLLRGVLERLMPNYPHIVIDNEAGMEHFSRRTQRRIDALFLVSDPTPVGLRAAKRIYELVREMGIVLKDAYLIVNQGDGIAQELTDFGPRFLGKIPYDPEIYDYSVKQKPLLGIGQDNQTVKIVEAMCREVIS